MEQLKNFFSLVPVSSFIMIVILFCVFIFIKRRTANTSLHFLGRLIPIFVVREILVTVFLFLRQNTEFPLKNPSLIFAFTDSLVLIVMFLWLTKYTMRKAAVIPFILLNAGFFAFLIANLVLNLFPDAPEMDKILTHIWLLGNWIVFGIMLFAVSEYNTANPQQIVSIRPLLMQFSIYFYVLFLLLSGVFGVDYGHPLIKDLLAPLYYIIFIYLFYKYVSFHETEEDTRIKFLENDLKSVFDFMENLGSAIAEKLELPQILNFITASAVKSTNAHAGSILLIDEFEKVLKVEAVNGVFPPPYPVPDMVKVKISSIQNYFKSLPIKIGETILGEVAKTGKPIFIKNTQQDERMKQNVQNDTLFVSSIIVLPLIVAKRIIGVISILKRERDQFFSESDRDHITTFANYASLTIDFIMTYMELIEKREMERELGIAAEIQQKLLPRKLPELKSASISAFSIPAKGVSGDYYDVLQFKGDRIGLVICDVAGKGVPAALIMVMIRSILHLITSAEKNAANVVTWINRGITGKIDIDRFATLSFMTYEEASQEIIYSNAAHHPLLLFRAKTATIETIDTEGLPIGIERTAKFGQRKFKVNKGDIVVLYTDGIIEAMNQAGEQYTYERFSQLIMGNSTLSTVELLDKIKSDLKAFVGPAPQHDDQTLLLMKVN